MARHHFIQCHPLVIDPQETGPRVATGDGPLLDAPWRIKSKDRVRWFRWLLSTKSTRERDSHNNTFFHS
jgi:hypothetical protein